MKQTNKLKMIAAMAVSITVALFISSCSNDEFMDIWDDTIYKESSFKISRENSFKKIAFWIKNSRIV